MQATILAGSHGVIVACAVAGVGLSMVRVLHVSCARLPAPSFTALRREIALPHRPRASRMRLPDLYRARREMQTGVRRAPPGPPDPDMRPESERGWALASLALMVLVVVMAWCLAGVRLH